MIVGGGLAGLAAAVALLDVPGGPAVELFERRGVLGGRAASSPGEDGVLVDNCQHVLMRCCTNLWDFYGRLGVQSRIRFVRRLNFLGRDGRIATLSGAGAGAGAERRKGRPARTLDSLPAPLHMAPSFLRFGALGPVDKIGVVRAMLVIHRTPPKRAAALESIPFAEWLRRMRQTPRAIARFWRVVLVSALNEELEYASTATAFQVFRVGFLSHPRAYEVGIPTAPLGELYAAPIERYFARHGAVLRLRTGVQAIDVEEGAVRGVRTADGAFVPAEHVIAAVPFDGIPKLLPPDLVAREPYFRRLEGLTHSPITAVHIWFDRPVTELDHAVLLDRQIQWMFNKTLDYGLDPEREAYLGLVVSASRDWLPRPRAEILEIARREVEDAFPRSREAHLVRWAVVKEAKATFSVRPGSEALRPPPRSPIRGLWLAGDWTQTGWPATMEGAARSGYRCAEEILSELGTRTSVLRPDGVFED